MMLTTILNVSIGGLEIQKMKQKKPNIEDTAIIISSSWLPEHPSTHMLDTMIDYIKHIHGLPPTSPIIITIDWLPTTIIDENFSKHISALDYYTTALSMKYFKHL